ncbi:uncharacterized protein LOC9648802 isoform X1 [Selaginella moellendorffii]|uniref:uncharacterized protein LOC9648802 isoform X1 n=1 Tax=Selaginella moellendorffii TaxID=88036 RepID=UPI000D1C80B9|nr:uncharacterized protein LOC9648802 isoform X1 [Selaginella moellendorffii]XP_024537071.1 uncharacterized protein LOC9648802 isoform X1 [Selaginella moellendorffii]|eukprot:XP_002976372.2 uncharacterized protein LOC9648802 isoform X1 [Selaginella moellendorffii]
MTMCTSGNGGSVGQLRQTLISSLRPVLRVALAPRFLLREHSHLLGISSQCVLGTLPNKSWETKRRCDMFVIHKESVVCLMTFMTSSRETLVVSGATDAVWNGELSHPDSTCFKLAFHVLQRFQAWTRDLALCYDLPGISKRLEYDLAMQGGELKRELCNASSR